MPETKEINWRSSCKTWGYINFVHTLQIAVYENIAIKKSDEKKSKLYGLWALKFETIQ